MKKMIPVLIAAALVAIVGCKEDTTLRWRNASGGQTATDIKWVPTTGNEISYSETLTADGEVTEYKTIDEDSRSGQGECNLGGTPGFIEYGGASTGIKLSEGSSETYEIQSVAKK
jgi:hypothetical protein